MSHGILLTLTELIALQQLTRGSRHSRGRQPSGGHRSPSRGRGMDFTDVRHYQAGDDIRHMEWHVTARTGKPHIKLYEEERERPVVIWVDFSASMYFGTRIAFKSHVAARLAALIAWTANKQGDRVGGIAVSSRAHRECIPKARQHGVLPFLSALAHFSNPNHDAQEPSPVNHALDKLERVVKPGSVLVLISDFYALDNSLLHHLSRLAQHNTILAYRVCDPMELAPPSPGIYPIANGHITDQLDLRYPAAREAYQALCDTRHAVINDCMQRLKAPCVQVNTATSLPFLIQQTFPRRHHG